MTCTEIRTRYMGRTFDEGTIEIKPFATRADYAHLMLKDADGNEIHIAVDTDSLATIIGALQDQLKQMVLAKGGEAKW